MNSKDFAIGILSTTAVILFVGVVVIGTRPLPALGDGMTTRGGHYILTVGALSQGDDESLYVLDTRSERLAVYRFDANRREIRIMQGIDLAEYRENVEDELRRRAETQRPGSRRLPQP